jgi:NAD(P)-dependent dehydrogenase (short-subunit alcohol dehydrogenase family)
MTDVFSLDGKNAVVTGLSTGIGQSIAEALARQGANVAGDYVNNADGAAETSRRIEAHSREALIVHGSTADETHVHDMADQVAARWGSVDIWVNNAARIFVKPFLEISTDEWHELLAANLHGYFHGCKAAAAKMATQEGPGRIINITSQSDVQAINGFSAYITAKGGILGLTRVLALELADHDITVNSVSPGPTDTPLNRDAWTPKARATYLERIGLHRIAEAEEIADVVCFVASHASRFITGQELIVDGGLSINGNVGHAETDVEGGAVED